MARITIPWNDGNGNIILTYTGQGDGTVTVASSTDNLGEDRSQVLTFKTVDGTVQVQVTVYQPTGMQTLRVVTATILTANGDVLRVQPTTV